MGTVKNLLPYGVKVRHRDRNSHHRCEIRDNGHCAMRAEWTGFLGGRCDVLICAAHKAVLGALVSRAQRIST